MRASRAHARPSPLTRRFQTGVCVSMHTQHTANTTHSQLVPFNHSTVSASTRLKLFSRDGHFVASVGDCGGHRLKRSSSRGRSQSVATLRTYKGVKAVAWSKAKPQVVTVVVNQRTKPQTNERTNAQ